MDDGVILVSIVVSIPACHAGDRGSIPRRGGFFSLSMSNASRRSSQKLPEKMVFHIF